jgi:SAM-dependent methyltransferase
MDAFTKIAPYYEHLMQGVPYSMWLSYLRLIWTKLEVEPKSVLEVACGTGKLCRMLAAEGIRVTGVDASAAMIEVAKSIAIERKLEIAFHVQDAAELDLDEDFDAAISFFDSLNNILDLERFRSALASVCKSLYPGAPFLFDLNTAYAFEKNMFDQSNMKRSEELRYNWVGSWNAKSRTCTIEMDFWKGNEHFHETHVQRAYSDDEVRQAMSDAGFIRVQQYDAYTLNPPKKTSDRIHVIGIAPERLRG